MKTRGFFSKFLVAMLSFLGVACQGVDLYGSPEGEFKIIEGNVTDESSHPLQGAKLTLIDGSSRLASTSQQDGYYFFTLDDNTYVGQKFTMITHCYGYVDDTTDVVFGKYGVNMSIGISRMTVDIVLKEEDQ